MAVANVFVNQETESNTRDFHEGEFRMVEQENFSPEGITNIPVLTSPLENEMTSQQIKITVHHLDSTVQEIALDPATTASISIDLNSFGSKNNE